MRIGSAIASGTRHVIGVGFQALLIVAIIAALAFAAAAVVGTAPAGADSVFAARGGTKGAPGGTIIVGSSISVNGTDQGLVLGSSVTFATSVADLTGNEYALVYLECTQGGTVVYGQLDLPGTTFVLGGGSSPWLEVGGPATCVGYLKAYGTHGGSDTVRDLAQTAPFSAN
ncbi:MAG: hypothetical protein HYX54_05630 [Chloroflexi bacterium]|nr:hypothetical protein [Chloroflexota bacterium]